MADQAQINDLVVKLDSALSRVNQAAMVAGMAIAQDVRESDPARKQEFAEQQAQAMKTFEDAYRTLLALADVLGVPRRLLAAANPPLD